MSLPKDRGRFIYITKTFLPTNRGTPKAFAILWQKWKPTSNVPYYSIAHYHVNILSYFVFFKKKKRIDFAHLVTTSSCDPGDPFYGPYFLLDTQIPP